MGLSFCGSSSNLSIYNTPLWKCNLVQASQPAKQQQNVCGKNNILFAYSNFTFTLCCCCKAWRRRKKWVNRNYAKKKLSISESLKHIHSLLPRSYNSELDFSSENLIEMITLMECNEEELVNLMFLAEDASLDALSWEGDGLVPTPTERAVELRWMQVYVQQSMIYKRACPNSSTTGISSTRNIVRESIVCTGQTDIHIFSNETSSFRLSCRQYHLYFLLFCVTTIPKSYPSGELCCDRIQVAQFYFERGLVM